MFVTRTLDFGPAEPETNAAVDAATRAVNGAVISAETSYRSQPDVLAKLNRALTARLFDRAVATGIIFG
jgi:hypothetical protein